MTKTEKNRINKKVEHEQDRTFKRRVRKAITHRNGVPLLTRKMIRELKSHTNPLEQLIIIFKNVFPNLLTDLANLTDIRNSSYVEYSMQEITIIRLIALCCGIQSMKEIITKLDKENFIENINQILDTDLKEFPCDDTISNVMNSIDILELEKLRTKLTKKLIESKTLDKFRLSNGSFYVVIDGTGLYSTRIDLGKNCIYKVHNKGTDDEYTEYQYYVLEAKLICNDYVFSFATEFVENEYMNNETEKQDCELKAAHRLLDKIRVYYPKLPITIGADALYVNKPFIETCLNHKMDYILRYKDSVMSTIMEEFNTIEKNTYKNYEYVNNIGFGCGTKESEGSTNIIKYILSHYEPKKEDNSSIDLSHKLKENSFMFITSIQITKSNYEEIVLFGRRRWKIENQGFKAQKSKVLNIEHCYTFSSNGTKAHYYFIQIAHLLLTILYYGSAIIKKLKETKVEISNLIYQELLKIQDMNLEQGFQIRFD